MDSPSAGKPLAPLNGGVQRNLSLNSGGTLISEEDIVLLSVEDFRNEIQARGRIRRTGDWLRCYLSEPNTHSQHAFIYLTVAYAYM